ncbi:DUF262 domain-containing protein [Vibrio vulnificus]|uniref:DUF262 domain-containing protein n=1 Tax=Vibrio vulnificus TaxID=672 RepID=UPI000CD228BD|nr:DUF262 domain-containing protein [Vibrio vulnificus]EGQ7938454.1 DUF262 domain-containing protein [Vibrio vulnificus]EHD1697000.1 DUF262 domain-containing protein [Vibrio vulnificus]EHU4977477.1 DUF262 domain-containing protein [Vibrio vulnificus]EII3055615.1 DUF262 domain-containing protein [Vibrio vulnificus]ELS0752173.1 DUF262 domain-containing protein [Vibrio vulnificus]
MFKVQSHTTRTLSWWFKQSEKIDFEPSYQRKGNLWGDRDKAYLIDSIVNGFDIPKIYLADFTIVNSQLNEKNLSYAVIDGRQRLESIFAFMSDKIALNQDFIYYANPSIKVGGKYYSELKLNYPEITEVLDEFNLDVMSVIADDVDKIKDLFVRLNKSKPLTGAELRNAMEGVIPDLIRGLVDRPFFKENIRFSTQRGQDSNAAAKILLIQHRGRFVDTKKVNLDKFVTEGAKSENPEDYVDSAFIAQKNIDLMHEIFEPKDTLLSAQGLMPIIYVLVRDNLAHRSYIRPFIAEFLHARKTNVEISKLHPQQADQTFLAFDSYIKNANDSGGLQGSYDILNSKFQDYILSV